MSDISGMTSEDRTKYVSQLTDIERKVFQHEKTIDEQYTDEEDIMLVAEQDSQETTTEEEPETSQAQQNKNMSEETVPLGVNPTIIQQQQQKDDGDIGLSESSTAQKKLISRTGRFSGKKEHNLYN